MDHVFFFRGEKDQELELSFKSKLVEHQCLGERRRVGLGLRLSCVALFRLVLDESVEGIGAHGRQTGHLADEESWDAMQQRMIE